MSRRCIVLLWIALLVTGLVAVACSDTTSNHLVRSVSAPGPVEPVSCVDAGRAYREPRYGEAAELLRRYALRYPDVSWGRFMHGLPCWKDGDVTYTAAATVRSGNASLVAPLFGRMVSSRTVASTCARRWRSLGDHSCPSGCAGTQTASSRIRSVSVSQWSLRCPASRIASAHITVASACSPTFCLARSTTWSTASGTSARRVAMSW